MSYKALYRSYRPTTFSEVIGQTHIIKTLKNALIEQKTSHAYIFSGLRGIGKTTIARIFAKAVNCDNLVDGEPCNYCKSCLSIMNNETTDIVELDAASNNSVEEIRNLLDKVNFLPSALKKKVYIIDEAHMLSTSAFNALLKTLEEPPQYVMFILATTEPNKIPMTILSRCQRFDFQQFTIEELMKGITKVAQSEQIEITDEAKYSIAEAAEGGMRDALGILDQASIYSNEKITLDDVEAVTGRVSTHKLIELISKLKENDAVNALGISNELLAMGKEVSNLVSGLIELCRDLLLYKNTNGENIKATSLYNMEDFQNLADTLDSKTLFYYIDVFADIQNKIRFTNSQKICLEVGIMKIVNTISDELDSMKKIDKIQKQLDSLSIESSSSQEENILLLKKQYDELQLQMEKMQSSNEKEILTSRMDSLEEQLLKSPMKNDNDNESIQIEIDNLTDKVNQLLLVKDQTSQENSNEFDSKINELVQKVESLQKDICETKPLQQDVLELKTNLFQLSNNTSVELPNKDNDSELAQAINEIKDQVAKLSKDYQKELDLSKEEVSQTKETLIALSQKVLEVEKMAESLKNMPTKENQEVEASSPAITDDINQKLAELETKINQIESNTNQTSSNASTNVDEKITFISSQIEDIQNEILEMSSTEKEENPKTNNIEKEQFDQLAKKVDELTQNNKPIESNEVAPKQMVQIEMINQLNMQYNDLKNQMDKLSNQPKVDELSTKITELQEKIDGNNKYLELQQYIDSVKEYALKQSLKITELQSQLAQTSQERTSQINEKTSQEKEPINQPEEKAETIAKEVVQEKSPQTVVIPETKEVNVYDIRIVEKTLHEARDPECREQKMFLQANWPKIEDKVGSVLAPIARLLVQGSMVANGKDELILVYPNATTCNYLMQDKNHRDAKQLLLVTFRKNYDFICLPGNTWQEKRAEYRAQFSMGVKYPKLTPIQNPELKVIQVNQDAFNQKDESLRKAEEIFGKDLIIKEN